MLFPGHSYHGDSGDEDDNPSAGAGGAGAGSHRGRSSGDALDGAFSDSWASSLFAGGLWDGVCLLSVLLLVLLFLVALLSVVFNAVFMAMGVDTGDAMSLVALLVIVLVLYCLWSTMMDEGDEYRGDGMYSYASS